jgi:hypothetical protein
MHLDVPERIVNGNFDVSDPLNAAFGWSTTGAAAVVTGAGVLTEDSAYRSRFSQSLEIPAEATSIRFTIEGLELGTSSGSAPDAFEVALLDAHTGLPLVGPVAGVTSTDALLNVQADGTTYLAGGVTVGGDGVSGVIRSYDEPVTVVIDLSGLTVDTTATLYFDLLGFGLLDSTVTIDNVYLLGVEPPFVDLELDPASDSGVQGDRLTNQAVVTLLGTTDPGQEVEIDLDGDNDYDDGTITAGADGKFQITGVSLAEGSNAIRARATAEGSPFSEITILRDSERPSGQLVFPAVGATTSEDLGYVDIQWSDGGLAGLDLSTLGASDITISGVTVDRIEDRGNGLIRYLYSDGDEKLPAGQIYVAAVQGSVLDLAGNDSQPLAASFEFTAADPELRVVEVIVNDGDAQRSNIETLTVRFDRDARLDQLIANGRILQAAQIVNSSGQAIPLGADRFTYDPSTFELRIDLTTGGQESGQATILADGRYSLRLDTREIELLVEDDGRNDLFQDYDFHRLESDFDGDADVDLNDRALFYQHYGTNAGDPNYDYAFDMTKDGKTDIYDYGVWKKQYRKTV